MGATDVIMASDEALWRGVLNRNAILDGRFFYAVLSTGVYCRPSCPSRRPNRRNVLFFRTLRSAERAGFRPCRRCLPRVHAEAAEKQAITEELQRAAEIQRNLLPRRIRIPEDWDSAFASVPCREIGGDTLDLFWSCRHQRLAFALGDVAGKGVPAALSASCVHAGLRAQIEAQRDLPAAMSRLDQYLSETLPGNRFVSLFCGLLNPSTGWVNYVNAGHLPGLLISSGGKTRRLDSGGGVLGLLPGQSVTASSVRLQAGDTLLLYSDGITESLNRNGEELRVDGLERMLLRILPASAQEIGDRFQKLVEEQFKEGELADDCSWLVLRRSPTERLQ